MSTEACTPFRHPFNFCLVFVSCEHLVWCEKAGQPNTWTFLKALVVSSQSCLSSQRLRAETTEPEVLRLQPLPLQRPAESIETTAIVCCAGVLHPTCSEDLGKPQRGLAEMLSLPDTVNMLGTQTIKAMWNLVLQWGMFVISVKLLGVDPIHCRRS